MIFKFEINDEVSRKDMKIFDNLVKQNLISKKTYLGFSMGKVIDKIDIFESPHYIVKWNVSEQTLHHREDELEKF